MKLLNEAIINCRQCNRLCLYTSEVAHKKVKRFQNEEYWGKPVPGFGDLNAELYILGLAPAAHGANRTGRMFTGDSSGNWLYKVLYETGFSSQPNSDSKHDCMVLKNVYISAIVKCAPPNNKPTVEEIKTCSSYFKNEIALLKNIKVVLCLGGLAFNTYSRQSVQKIFDFYHGAEYRLPDGKILLVSYHPSRQNTQTGKLKWDKWKSIFERVENILSKQ